MQSHITIFTDGASSGNPGPGGWGAIVAHDTRVTELGGGEDRTTNNRMELSAVKEALAFVVEQGMNHLPITLYTDSSYVANGITSWLRGWKSRNWTNKLGEKIANVDIWQAMPEILASVQLKIENVSGHSGIPGNERADEIATGFVREKNLPLYHGAADEYPVDLKNISVDPDLKKSKDRKKGKAFSYLSLVDKKLEIHKTWDECKRRVEGKKGARYKKSISQEDENMIRRSWGV